MKKLILTILTAIFLLLPVVAQESEEVFVDTEIYDEGTDSNSGFISTIKLGGNFTASIPLGDLSEFTGLGYGGGIDFEMGIPIWILQDTPFVGQIFKNFAVGVEANYNYLVSKNENLANLMNIQACATALTLIPIGAGFSVVPEIGIGVAINIPAETGGNININNIYVDQIYSFSAGIRFSHPKMLNDRLEFQITPTYSISPEYNSAVQYFSFKFGVLGRIK